MAQSSEVVAHNVLEDVPGAQASRQKSHCAYAPHGKSPLSGATVDARKKVSAASAAAAYRYCPVTVVSWYSSWYRSCGADKGVWLAVVGQGMGGQGKETGLRQTGSTRHQRAASLCAPWSAATLAPQ